MPNVALQHILKIKYIIFAFVSSREWKEFRGFCFSAFRILRRSANVFLNLFSLMLDSGIPDIAIEKEKAVRKIEQR